MNSTDPAADPLAIDVRDLTREIVKRLPNDPVLFQRLVVDLRVLVHEQRQEKEQLRRQLARLERLLESRPAESLPRKKKRRRH